MPLSLHCSPMRWQKGTQRRCSLHIRQIECARYETEGLIDYQLLPPSPWSHLGCPLWLHCQLTPQCMQWCVGMWSMQQAYFVDVVVEDKMEVKVLTFMPIANQVQPNQTSGLCLPVIHLVASMVDGCLPMRLEAKSTMNKGNERKRILEVVQWWFWHVCVPQFCNQLWNWFIFPCSWKGCH